MYNPTKFRNMLFFGVPAWLLVDGYKTGHPFQYPAKTQMVFSNWTARNNGYLPVPDRWKEDKYINFGLAALTQYLLHDYWKDTVFDQPAEPIINEYQEEMDLYLGPKAVTTDHLRKLHGYGRLPLNIYSLPEGDLVDIRVPSAVLFNTQVDADTEFGWVTNAIETQLSSERWSGDVIATIAFTLRRMGEYFATLTGSPLDFVRWQFHDFSFRGISSIHSAILTGIAHLTSFYGTDTVPAISAIRKLYGDTGFIGGSVPATEHAVMCISGQGNELETYRRLLTQTYPTGICSIVSDTWDLWQVLTKWLPLLKDEIMARDGKCVIRPDSGDPIDILAGVPCLHEIHPNNLRSYMMKGGRHVYDAEKKAYFRLDVTAGGVHGPGVHMTEVDPSTMAPHEKGVVQLLWELFGGTITELGYRMLNSHIGTIYGDSITPARAEAIWSRLALKGFASACVVFGIGSYTYQYVTRDSLSEAVKATYGIVDGIGYAVQKDPVTDNGTKKSATGLLAVLHNPQSPFNNSLVPMTAQTAALPVYTLTENSSLYAVENCSYLRYMEDGVPDEVDQSFASVRARVDRAAALYLRRDYWPRAFADLSPKTLYPDHLRTQLDRAIIG